MRRNHIFFGALWSIPLAVAIMTFASAQTQADPGTSPGAIHLFVTVRDKHGKIVSGLTKD